MVQRVRGMAEAQERFDYSFFCRLTAHRTARARGASELGALFRLWSRTSTSTPTWSRERQGER